MRTARRITGYTMSAPVYLKMLGPFTGLIIHVATVKGNN